MNAEPDTGKTNCLRWGVSSRSMFIDFEAALKHFRCLQAGQWKMIWKWLDPPHSNALSVAVAGTCSTSSIFCRYTSLPAIYSRLAELSTQPPGRWPLMRSFPGTTIPQLRRSHLWSYLVGRCLRHLAFWFPPTKSQEILKHQSTEKNHGKNDEKHTDSWTKGRLKVAPKLVPMFERCVWLLDVMRCFENLLLPMHRQGIQGMKAFERWLWNWSPHLSPARISGECQVELKRCLYWDSICLDWFSSLV